MPDWADDVPDGTALAIVTGTRKNKENMPLLVLTIVDKREHARWDRVDEITVCPFRGYSFALGGSEGGGCYGESTVVGLGNIVSAAELYTADQALFDGRVCCSNIRWGGDGSAPKILLKGLLCEALITWLDNAYGDGIILNPRTSVIDQYLNEVLEWLEQYRVSTAREVNLDTQLREKYEDEIGGLNDKIAELSAEKETDNARIKQLEEAIAVYNDMVSKLSSEKEELEKEILRYKAAAAFSKVTIDELNEERKDSISKKEIKRRLAKAAASLKRK
jgi:hypothetical protein